jgi:NAD(P)-dependent dehydrogenase (short-subunit alcohol dehydrogenase family)
MGRSLVKAALQHNDLVCAVGQSHLNTLGAMQNWHPQKPERHLGLLCDVRVRETVDAVIARAIKHFGHIDIIANCSGYGVIGACEDQDEYEIRNQFETNFMGTLHILQLSLPHFRQRGEGRYLIFSSTSGALGVPGLGPYCATKYAVEGLIESMLYEVDGFGIRATLVEPSHLRRDDAHIGHSVVNGETDRIQLYSHFRILKPSQPYSGIDAPAKHAQRLLQWIGDHQPTSVVKAAELSWQLGHCSFPPLRLLLGTYAVESVRDRLKSVIEEIEDWKYLSFPPIEGMDEKEEGEDGREDVDGEDNEDEGSKDEDEDDGEADEDRADVQEEQGTSGKRSVGIKREQEDEQDVAMEED